MNVVGHSVSIRKTKLDDKKYCRELYNELLKQYSERENAYDRLYFTKREKDILVILLQRAKPNLELKWVRKLVRLDTNRIADKAWEEICILEKRRKSQDVSLQLAVYDLIKSP